MLAGAVVLSSAVCPEVSAQFCPNGFPQASLPLECGMGAVTCFSGFVNFNPSAGIDLDGYVVAVVDFRDPATNSPGTGMNWCAPFFHNEFPVNPDTWNAAHLGQVFGIALDAQSTPNIYVTATTVYGSDDPTYQNGNTVALASSPFGPGGAGAVYQLNGTTGAISTLATLPNTGPGLGDICFDRSTGNFYVSNFEDGRVYRLSTAGACLSTFDHFTDAVGGCAPEAGDPAGFVPLRERVWAVKVLGDRLYYSLWLEDRGRPNSAMQNEIWSVQLDGAGEFLAGTKQLEIQIPSFPGEVWSDPVSDISFSSVGRMMLAERNMLADVGAGARYAWASDGHRSRNLEYELNAGTWVASGRDFFIGQTPSGPGTNSAGGVDYDCEDNVWSTGDQLLLAGNPVLATYGLQWTPEPGNTIPTITTVGYFIDLDGISTVQSKNRIGDVVVYNGCCDCMTVDVTEVLCEYDPATGLTGKYTVTMEVRNDSGVTAQYVLLPDSAIVPHIVPLVPPLPSGTGETRTITFQICDIPAGTTYCFDVVLADATVEECCATEVCIDLPLCDCLQFTDVSITCDPAGNLAVSFTMANLTNDVIEHVFVFKPLPPDPNAGITVTPDYFDLTGSPIPPFTTASIGPITISGAIPGSNLCLLISAHNGDLQECCAEELCFDVPDCDPDHPVGACCLPDGTCIQATPEACQMAQGLFIAIGAPCSECGNLEPVGACCFDDGTCLQISVFECAAQGGFYLGDSTACADCPTATPVGACCLADGTCVQTSAVGCAASGGMYLGDGTSCDDCTVVEVGACCVPGGCQQLSPDECQAIGGTYLGAGTSCDDCPVPLACDLNGDGVVGIQDLFIMLAQWGPCNGCPADLDHNGSVDVFDLFDLLSWWGS